MKVKGVNLGNWLVLEKWMSPALFEGTTAEDEYYLPTQLSKEVYEARIKIHRSEYITERDFTRIKAMGMDAVRIPVPYFIFGDREPFIGCVEELDKAFNWTDLTTEESAEYASGPSSRMRWNLSLRFWNVWQRDTERGKAFGESRF